MWKWCLRLLHPSTPCLSAGCCYLLWTLLLSGSIISEYSRIIGKCMGFSSKDLYLVHPRWQASWVQWLLFRLGSPIVYLIRAQSSYIFYRLSIIIKKWIRYIYVWLCSVLLGCCSSSSLPLYSARQASGPSYLWFFLFSGPSATLYQCCSCINWKAESVIL